MATTLLAMLPNYWLKKGQHHDTTPQSRSGISVAPATPNLFGQESGWKMSDFKTGSLDETLEALIDKHGLLQIVTGLDLICAEKAEHLRVNWQDKASARVWDRAANALQTASRKIAE